MGACGFSAAASSSDLGFWWAAVAAAASLIGEATTLKAAYVGATCRGSKSSVIPLSRE